MDKGTKYSPVVIIGSGESGLCMAIQLKQKLGFTDFTIYERHSDLGGTWWANTYPGCACDIPAVFYSYSFAMNPRWSQLYPKASEMHAYFREVASKYCIQPHISFNTEVESASWDDSRKLWIVKLRRREVAEWEVLMGSQLDETGRGGTFKTRTENAGETWTHECKVLISGAGALVEPNFISMDGSENFKGDIMHTARWDHNVSMKDKNVVLVGNGCSAIQVIPAIADDVKSVTQISRSPHWIIERDKVPLISMETYSKWAPTLFANIPGLMKFVRFYIFCQTEGYWFGFKKTKLGEKVRKEQERNSRNYIKRNAPEKYWPLLIPEITVGAKRRVFDDVYAGTLNRENVHLTAGSVARLTENTVITDKGEEYPADVIVLATGYKTNDWFHPLQIYGKGGVSLNDFWAKKGGPAAYHTTAITGFPNFFVIFGPNSATGHSSVILGSENITNYIIKMITPILKEEATDTMIKEEAYNEYSNLIRKWLSNTIWAKGREECESWYTREDGWNSMTYPRSQLHFAYRSHFPTYSHWVLNKTPYGIYMTRMRRFLAMLMIFGAGALGVLLRRRGWGPNWLRERIEYYIMLSRAAAVMAAQRVKAN